MAAIRTRRFEEDASHVTLARQRNQASRVSNLYNLDDYDFALVLSPDDAVSAVNRVTIPLNNSRLMQRSQRSPSFLHQSMHFGQVA